MKKILSLAASIISLFIVQFLILVNSNSEENNSKYYSNDKGILSLMYHRFNENKYPSTNIKMDVFRNQIDIIKNLNYDFYDPKFLIEEFEKPKDNSALSNLAIIGRYILTPDIFDILRNIKSDKNGEIQITDALREQAKKGKVIAYKFKGNRFDCGNVRGYLDATNYFAKTLGIN